MDDDFSEDSDISNHFLPSFDRITEEFYSPSSSDILTARIPTTGKGSSINDVKVFRRRGQGFCDEITNALVIKSVTMVEEVSKKFHNLGDH